MLCTVAPWLRGTLGTVHYLLYPVLDVVTKPGTAAWLAGPRWRVCVAAFCWSWSWSWGGLIEWPRRAGGPECRHGYSARSPPTPSRPADKEEKKERKKSRILPWDSTVPERNGVPPSSSQLVSDQWQCPLPQIASRLAHPCNRAPLQSGRGGGTGARKGWLVAPGICCIGCRRAVRAGARGMDVR